MTPEYFMETRSSLEALLGVCLFSDFVQSQHLVRTEPLSFCSHQVTALVILKDFY